MATIAEDATAPAASHLVCVARPLQVGNRRVDCRR
jgi:hypothetical protein